MTQLNSPGKQSHQNTKKSAASMALLWGGAGIFGMGALFSYFLFPEYAWVSAILAVLLVADLVVLIRANHLSLKNRSVAYGLNSAVTSVLVLGIVVVLNFLAARYPQKLDLTKERLHTLSEQTVKVVKGLQKPVKATLFQKIAAREKDKMLLDEYKGLNPKFEVEYVDPDREPTRAKQLGIRKYGTLQLSVGAKDNKIEDVTEEKLTNSLIKLLQEKTVTLCEITGHGEKSFASQGPDGYETAKKSLVNQSYEIKDINLVQENKIPETCSAIAVIGPSKALFAGEVKLISDYLAGGGRAIIAVDLNLQSGEYGKEIAQILEAWNVRPVQGLIVDPLSKMFGAEADVPIVATYSKDSPITRDFTVQSFFPTTRALEIIPGAPAGLNVQWLGQTTPKSVSITDLAQLKSGQVKLDPAKDKNGPFNIAVAVEGKAKDSKAPRNTRIVAFGSSRFAENQFSKFGGNLDFFLNAASWVLEDESLISIRVKEEGAGKVELSQKQGTFIFLLCVVAIPLLIAAAGVVIWAIRRRL